MRLFLALLEGWPVLGVRLSNDSRKGQVLDIVTEEAAKVDFAATPAGWALVPCDGARDFLLPSTRLSRSNHLALLSFRAAECTIPNAKAIAVVLTREAYIVWATNLHEQSRLATIESSDATHVLINFILDR